MDELMVLHQMVERLEKSIESVRELRREDVQMEELAGLYGQSYDWTKAAGE